MPTDLTQQIVQFRSRYPFASLTSELLMVHQEAYVVRAVAQIGSVVIATAMATSPDLEKAEDRAKARVLEMLNAALPLPQQGLNLEDRKTTSFADSSLLTSSPAPISPVAAVPSSSFAPDANLAQSPPTRTQSPPLNEQNLASSKVASRISSSDALPPMDDTIPGLEPSVSKQEYAPSARPKPAPAKGPAKLRTPAAPVETTETTQTALTPKDLSDVIAKTSVELRRLGWTDEAGRQHLQSAYGKRSRQQLTDPELVDFLHHLEQQPTPRSDRL